MVHYFYPSLSISLFRFFFLSLFPSSNSLSFSRLGLLVLACIFVDLSSTSEENHRPLHFHLAVFLTSVLVSTSAWKRTFALKCSGVRCDRVQRCMTSVCSIQWWCRSFRSKYSNLFIVIMNPLWSPEKERERERKERQCLRNSLHLALYSVSTFCLSFSWCQRSHYIRWVKVVVVLSLSFRVRTAVDVVVDGWIGFWLVKWTRVEFCCWRTLCIKS